MSEQTPEQPDTSTVEATETEAEEQRPPERRQDRRDGHVRERLKEVESERDRLRERIDARDRADVAAAARAALGEAGSVLFRYDIADLRDPETGDLDPQRIEESLRPIREALTEGRTQHHGDLGVKRTAKGNSTSWGEMIQRGR